eukprot:9498293-Pyramimonas_sp.AAC.1
MQRDPPTPSTPTPSGRPLSGTKSLHVRRPREGRRAHSRKSARASSVAGAVWPRRSAEPLCGTMP